MGKKANVAKKETTLGPFELSVKKLKEPDPSEPDDRASQADSMILGQKVRTRLFPKGDKDLYRFRTPKKKGYLILALKHPPKDPTSDHPLGEVTVNIYNAGSYPEDLEDPLHYFELIDAEGEKQFVELKKPGEKLLSIEGRGWSRSAIEWELDHHPKVDPNEPDEDSGQAYVIPSLPDTMRTFIFPSRDYDHFKLKKGMVEGALMVDVVNGQGTKPVVELYKKVDEKGNTLRYMPVKSKDPPAKFVVSSSFTYYFSVTSREEDQAGRSQDPIKLRFYRWTAGQDRP